MPEIDDIISQTMQSIEDEFSGLFCTCKHLLKEHSVGKCYALDFNGTVWSSCDCTKVKIYQFKVKTNVFIELPGDRRDSNTEDSTEIKEAA